MELAVQPVGDTVAVHVKGRLDNTWANFLAHNLDQIVAGGARDLRIDLSDVNFISSAGIGVLIRYYNQLRSIQGSFVVVRTSARVSAVLKQVELDAVLCGESTVISRVADVAPRRIECESALYDVYDIAPAASLRCRCHGSPGAIFESSFLERECRQLAGCRFALGLGALGSDFEDCRERFGEFIAVEGGVAYQPTEGTNPPDYLVCADNATAEVQVLYGLACEGDFSHLIRFEARRSCGPLPMTDIVSRAVSLSGGKAVGIVMIAEVAGLVGAALRRSPVEPATTARFSYPGVGQWFSFSPERALNRTVAVAAGVASSPGGAELNAFLRPLTPAGDLVGHFHAAVFSYRPMQRGMLQVSQAVKHVFESETLLSVLHLLNDTRPTIGAGQSDFERGACWVAGISEIVSEDA